MLKVITIIVVILVIAVVVVLVIAATKPETFRVQRTIGIKAPPDKVFALINDLRGWSAWSAYEKKDPNMKRTFGPIAAGKGATYEWDGDKNVGQGRMEIIEAIPPSKIVIDLQFLRPFEARHTAEFSIQPAPGDGTTVTWAMYGKNLFIGKVMGIFINMDKMIGNDFETGLANLKALAEK